MEYTYLHQMDPPVEMIHLRRKKKTKACGRNPNSFKDNEHMQIVFTTFKYRLSKMFKP